MVHTYYQLSHLSNDKEVPTSFIRYVNDLLNLPITELQWQSAHKWFDRARMNRATHGCDLVLVRPPSLPFWQRCFMANPVCWLSAQLARPLLVISRPRYPFRRLLLVIRNEKSDRAAKDWALRIAQASKSVVTVLPLIPQLPNFLNLNGDLSAILTQLRNSHSALGKTLRQIEQDFDRFHIYYEFQLQRGIFYQQVSQALDDIEPELIIIGADLNDWSHRLLTSPLMPPLLRCQDRPILIAKPTREEKANAYA